jgi:hypothetical protein
VYCHCCAVVVSGKEAEVRHHSDFVYGLKKQDLLVFHPGQLVTSLWEESVAVQVSPSVVVAAYL